MSSTPIVDRIRIIPRPEDFLDRTVGASGEVFFSRETNTLRVYSGKDRGGFEIAKSDLSNIPNSVFAAKAVAAGVGGGSPGEGGTSISVGDSIPQDPENGNLWLNTSNGFLYVYINDGSSAQWMQPAVPPTALPTLSTVAFTGNYNDLTDKPIIGESGFSGSYDDLSNKPDLTLLAPKASPNFTGTLIASGNSAFGSGLTQANLDLTPGGIVAVNVKGFLSLTEGSILFYKPSGFENAVPFGTPLWSIGKTNFNDDFAITNQEGSNEVLRISPTTNEATFYGPVTVNGLTTLQETTEVLNTISGATGTVVHDHSLGAVFYHSSMFANFTANFTNVPTTNNRTISVVLVLAQGATPRIPSGVQINGVGQTIRWQGAVEPTGTANRTDVVSFVFIRTSSTWTVIGSLSTYG